MKSSIIFTLTIFVLTFTTCSNNNSIKSNQENASRKNEEKRMFINEKYRNAFMYFERGEYANAISEWNKILERYPDDEMAKQYISTASLEQKIVKEELEKKEKDNEKLMFISEKYRDALMYYERGEYANAISEWNKILEHYPDHEITKECIKKAKVELELSTKKVKQN